MGGLLTLPTPFLIWAVWAGEWRRRFASLVTPPTPPRVLLSGNTVHAEHCQYQARIAAALPMMPHSTAQQPAKFTKRGNAISATPRLGRKGGSFSSGAPKSLQVGPAFDEPASDGNKHKIMGIEGEGTMRDDEGRRTCRWCRGQCQ